MSDEQTHVQNYFLMPTTGSLVYEAIKSTPQYREPVLRRVDLLVVQTPPLDMMDSHRP